MHKQEKNISKNIILGLMLGATTLYQSTISYAADNKAIPNNQLPSGGEVLKGSGLSNVSIPTASNNILNITQDGTNAVIKWQDFSIGANATVNFNEKNNNVFNTLNYINDGNISKIYGT